MSLGIILLNWSEGYFKLGKDRIRSKNLVNSRNNDRKRANEYKKELEEMKKRIQTRPYLFEQVTKVKPNHHSLSFSLG